MQPGDISAWFMHARLRVCLSFSVCVCVYKFVSLSVCLLRCSCFVPLMRGIQGLHGGLCKISFSCFAMKALLQRNRRNSLKWRRARLNYSAFTINFCRHCPHTSPRLASRQLLRPQSLQVHRGNVDNPLLDKLSGPVATPAAAGAWICDCKLVSWINK